MDVVPSTSRCNSAVNKQFSAVEIELYLLIKKYLSSGPCKKAYEVLRAEIEENQLLPKRYDWLGNEHRKSLDEVDRQLGHLSNDHLLRVVSRLGPAINQLVKLPYPSATTLLGAGTQSLLRTENDLYKSYKTLSDVVVRHRGYPPLEPVRYLGPPCLTQTILGRELQGTINQKHVVTNKFYSRIQLYFRSVGHLSAVYCMLFDRTGKYIITGADDTLVKIWSTFDGRLMATLRGASAEISDLAIDGENTLIAAGSCDKIIRVWSLQTLAPVAVLSSHTGMITALQFCPAPDSEGVLVSTGGDGCVAFWTYTRRSGEIKFDSKPLKVNERVRPGNAQLICASFSAGGHFLAVGGADHFVRVYHLGGEDGVEKLIETERHQDRVDSIQWCHKGLMFVSGSRDGTALVWRYETQQWKNLVLNMTDRLPGDSPPSEEIRRLQVTMVGWNRSDEYVITASNDKWLRVWDSSQGKLKHILRGHEDNSYVIEAHPLENNIILTAAHDGQLMIWDISTGTLVRSFKNTIEGQGYGALFDAKWSPDGYTIATTDSHGHLILFGIGHNEKFKKIPKELFFHTDYRPLVRDANNHVLDEQTQMAPHLMPPPFLVNMDGDPYPPEYQRLVPGRENCRHDQLIPNVLLNANGDQEVLDAALQDYEHPPANAPAPEVAGGQRPNIDEMIERLAQEQDQRIAHNRRPSDAAIDQPGPSNVRERRESSSARGERRASSGGPPTDHSYAVAALHDPLSPRASRAGTRRVGDVEGVRQSTGNWQRDPNMKWNRRIIIRQQQHSNIKQNLNNRRILGEYELHLYEEESRKKPEPVKSPEQQQHEAERKTRKKQKKQTHSYSTRSVRESRRGTYEGQEFEDAENPPGSSSPGTSSGTEIENEELQESSSSDDQSTDYSDWTADAGFSLEPPKRTAHKQKKSIRKGRRKGRLTSDDDDDKENKEDDDEEDDDYDDDVDKGKSTSTPRVQRKLRAPRPNLSELNGAADEIPEEYRPPEWLTETFPKKAPYFPQMGDELIYFMQGHMLYVEAVMNRKLYTIDKRSLPWMRTTNKLRDQEFVKIIGIKYEIKPPRLCCLKLGIMDLGRGKLTSDSFTIKYHDMPDVLDFLILKATYNYAMSRHWQKGDRFRCIIDDAWWLGTVESHEPHLPEFPDSMFMCYRVLWDNGEEERLSPWDMEPIDENMEVMERGGSVAVKPKELEELLYRPQSEEWAGRNPDQECDRISHGLSLIMTLAIAEPFLVPVDLNAYPMYALTIDYPMDLTTIKSRLDNRFYRRINAVQFDVRYLATNTEKFNQKGSNIVRQARIVTELCLKLIKDDTCIDPTPLYHELQANYHSPDHSDEDPTGESRGGGLRGEGKGSHSKGLRGRGQPAAVKKSWQQMCRDLLRSIFEKEDSIPFRFPVDLERYPDYSQVIDIPMDLTTVREELSASGYSTPHDFAKDVRLIFTNSKNYNTNKRSRIYSMTLRLEAYFEDQIKPILASYKSKDGASASAGERRSPVTSTAFGRPVVPPHRAEYSLSTTFEDEENHIEEEEEEEDIMDTSLFSNADGARRSRRVARKKLMNSNDDDDSGEEYNPRNRKKKSSAKTKKKGVATRNRGRVTVQYKEESEDEYVNFKNKNSGGNTKKKNVVESESNDNSSGCDIPGPSTKRTNGQLFGMKSRLESSSDESDEEFGSKGKSNGVNGVDNRKQARQGGVGKVTQPKSSEDSEDSSGSSSLSDDEGNDYSKDQSKGKLGYVKRRQSTSDSSSSSVGKAHPKGKSKAQIPPTSKGKPVNIKRYNKEESEVEFDDEDLESSTEESADDDLNSRRGRKRGVASSVRRARKIILDGDDEDDRDFIVDKDFIDDADMTEEESSSQSESDEGSEDHVKHVKKKKKEKKKAKSSKKKVPAKKNTKKTQPKKSNSKKKNNSNTKSKKAQPPSKRPQPKNVQELITVNRPGQSPIPYQPLSYGSQIVTVVDQIEHRGRVFGRVITSTCGENDHGDDEEEEEEEEEESESEGSDSEESSEGYPAPTYTKGKGKPLTNPTNAKRSYESDSDYECAKSKKSKKRPRYSEEEENEEVDVSSRGRVRKANTLMRDFI